MLSLIVAINKKGYIGKEGALMWQDADDLKHFKELTMGKTLIVGKKTWDKLPKLEGRDIVLVSHSLSDDELKRVMDEKVEWVPDFETAIFDCPDAIVIGGAQIYKQALRSGKVKYFYITAIDNEAIGDVYFPMADLLDLFNQKHAENKTNEISTNGRPHTEANGGGSDQTSPTSSGI